MRKRVGRPHSGEKWNFISILQINSASGLIIEEVIEVLLGLMISIKKIEGNLASEALEPMNEMIINSRLPDDRYSLFLELGRDIQVIGEGLGIQIQTVHQKLDPCFLKLNPSEQDSILSGLRLYQTLLQQVTEEGYAEEKKLLWYALKKLRLVSTSNMMDLIEDGDLVEVYMGTRQVYRTFNYYNLCSYSLDELASMPWDQLFHRPPEITAQIFNEIGAALQGRKVMISETPQHVVEELLSPNKYKFKYQLKYIVPLVDLETRREDCVLGVIKAERFTGTAH